jgi:hypothetical protein
MRHRSLVGPSLSALALLAAFAPAADAQEKLHFTYLWHLEQPIYWPDRQASGNDRYERAWESIQRTDAGAAHPGNNLRDIFGLADRQAVYQYRTKDSLNAFRFSAPEAGVQITYSGGLIHNITSLGNANQLGYGPGWANDIRTARSWQTSTASNNKPRMDVVLFSFHHALLPLVDDDAVRKEIQLYKRIYTDAWGTATPMSKGFFPSEMAFSTRLIPILASEGVNWSIVSSEHLSRACADFPVVFGSGGINCNPPNRADQINPNGVNYYRTSISRGCGPAEAVPFSYTPHRAQYIDPTTGVASSIIVVGAPQGISWRDGYAALGLSDFNNVQPFNNPSRPMLLVLSHDGDNAWGGGYSYYMEATPTNVNDAKNAGYVPSVVEKYLADHPVPSNDIVHVEQGAWVNADGDFGSPTFLNWNWPPVLANGTVDIETGWAEDIRNWAVITAAQNRVSTAEQIAGGASAIRIDKVLYPDASTTNAERAWHYFLGSLNSGYMYYGTSLDFEVKPTIACNNAMRCADPVIGTGAADATAPTIWEPQRYPWNPGSTNFGPEFGYKQVVNNGDFWVWTFAYDVSGLSSVNLKYRVDADGQNTLASTQNETYAGGAEVGGWQTVAMNRRVFPAGNFFNDPGINFYVMPNYIADQYSFQITGVRDKLLDYYIEATDTKGHVKRSAIQHVYVGTGAGSGGGGGGGTVVTVAPNPIVAGQNVTVTYDATGRNLASAPTVKIHHGINNWSPANPTDPAMSPASGKWTITFPVPANASQFDCVFNNGAGTWDNNGGADWHFPVTGTSQPAWTMNGIRDASSKLIATNNGLSLYAGLQGDILYVATNDAGEGNDHFIFLARTPGPLQASQWAKAGQVSKWDAFLADENDNAYSGWFDAGAGVTTQNSTGPNGGVIEGTINLAQKFGTLPDAIYLSVGPYPTADGSTLLHAFQVPQAVTSNGSLDANEYVRVDLCFLDPSRCPPPPCPCVADFDASGGTPDAGDVDAFFIAWLSGSETADADCSGGTPDAGDVDDFFTQWLAGGC